MKHITLFVSLFLILSNFIVSAAIYKPDPPHTSVGFNIKYLMITDVFGEFKSYNAKIEIDENTQNLVGVEAKIYVASLTTENSKRDGHLKSLDFLMLRNFPTFFSKAEPSTN